jgi:virginiamycin B lyase
MRIRLLLVALSLAGCTAGGGGATTTTHDADPSTSTTVAAATTTTADLAATTTIAASTTTTLDPESLTVESFPVPSGSRPHDVAPAADGGVWYTAQGSGELGWLDPSTGRTRHIDLGSGSRPHGVIVGRDGSPWITDGGLNALVSVDPDTQEVTIHPLPDTAADANLNTAVFDDEGVLWFTGQAGVYGSFDPSNGEMVVYEAPNGRGPYGITATPGGDVFYASLAGSYVGAIAEDGATAVLHPPTEGQGARRVWSDSEGSIWVSEWNSGQLSRYDPETGDWRSWPLPGDDPAAYAVFVDDADTVWVSDFGSNTLVRFDPADETFTSFPLPHQPGEVRQIHGRPGEVWGAESAADHLVLIRTR